jgi:TPR repeat protein
MYANGKGVKQDDAEAVRWYRKAAEQGNAKAQFNLGVMYDLGKGVKQDDAEAVKWYRKAAFSGGSGGVVASKPVAKTGRSLIPSYRSSLSGSNPVRIRNPNGFSVDVGLRSGQGGKDFSVPALGMKTIYVRDGSYDIYFVYSTEPDALYKGDSFTLRRNGVEIQIVQVVDGNYGIRRVK